MSYSVAMTGAIDEAMCAHLLREDGQEDVLAATYQLSTGTVRTTAVIRSVISPREGERHVHGNASFTSTYVLRAASEARARGEGLVLLHSHPGGRGWQGLSRPDHTTESAYGRTARGITDLPLLGMTLAGRDLTWSARFWLDRDDPQWAESVRVAAPDSRICWNDSLRPVPTATTSQVRTVSSWGAVMQGSIARTRVLVVGVGSVGLDVAQRLAATGIETVGVMDFDTVETLNLDRMIGATRLDAALHRRKTDVAVRLMKIAATADRFTPVSHDMKITSVEGQRAALDYDIIFSCVDRPWPRAVLNQVAYADLIPVIDGGIAIETFDDGRLRSSIWRAHTLVPGRPCMVCNGQLDLAQVRLDQDRLLDDPTYIARSGLQPPSSQNVAALSAGVSAALLAQFVSLLAHPGGMGVPGPLRFILAPHHLEHLPAVSGAHCPYEAETSKADKRRTMVDTAPTPTGSSDSAPKPTAELEHIARLEQELVDALDQLR
jgi:hypothetical protein